MTRRSLLLSALALTLLVTAVAYSASWKRNEDRALRNARERLALYEDTLLSKLDKYRYLPFVISTNRIVLRMMEHRATPREASVLLREINDLSGSSAIYVMDAGGTTLAASNFDQPTSFVGHNYAFREYFTAAMRGGEGALYAVGTTSGVPGYYLSHPIRVGQDVGGVAVVKVELTRLREVWSKADETIMATDRYGVVVFSGREDWDYHTTRPLTPKELAAIRAGRLYAGKPLPPLEITVDTAPGPTWAIIEDQRFLAARTGIDSLGWTLSYLIPYTEIQESALRLAERVLLGGLLMTAVLMLAWEHRLKEITTLELAETRRISELDRLREESLRILADSIAHQIRNPLIGIGGNANLISKHHPKDEDTAEHVAVIMDCCKSLERVVAAIRDYIDIAPGVLDIPDFRLLVRTAREEAEALPGIRPEQAEWIVDLAPVRTRLDPKLLTNALVELFRNALESSPGLPVALAVTGKILPPDRCPPGSPPDTPCYAIDVDDDGPGMTANVLAHAPDPFFTTKPDSVGMGLTKVQRIVQEMRGELTLFSPVPGETVGVRARIILPIDA